MAAKTLDQLLGNLQNDPEREQLAQEIEALQSIYSQDGAVSLWKPENHIESSRISQTTVRLDIRTALSPPHESVKFRILVSLPPTYPASTPPQLQILSRYIGDFQVDSTLFGSVLKTYISAGGVEFKPGEVAIFDGIENVREVVQKWYEDRLNANKAAELLREDSKPHSHTPPDQTEADSVVSSTPRNAAELPEGVFIWVSEPVVDRKSTFIGRACRITHPSEVPQIIDYLLEDKYIAKATHPVIRAWRCEVNGILHQDNDDDGETAAGARLAHLLQILDLKNVLVVVTRYFGGILLQGDRFRHINSVAREALEKGGFLDGPEDLKRNPRTSAKGSK
ncbi:UPF0029-domain-containing protein [Serendipita vermifera]|nr:UPF0029-domain-containing protein [Serendipita vermifera]